MRWLEKKAAYWCWGGQLAGCPALLNPITGEVGEVQAAHEGVG